MEDNSGEGSAPIMRPDHSIIKDGMSIFDGSYYDADDRLIGPIPMKQYASHQEWADAGVVESSTSVPMRWSELDAMQFPSNRWRVMNLIPRGGSAVLASVSGEGKTWVALELARCIAMGTNFLGDERFETEQGKVLYIDAENAKSELQRRGRQLSLIDSDNLMIWPIDDINLYSEEAAEDLISEILENKFDVVIIDTFRAVAGGLKEEKAEEVRTFFGRFKALKERNISLVWLDHFRKPSHFEGKVPKKEHLFGSQDKTASSEVLIMMKKEDEKISVYQRKNRLGKEINPFNIEILDHEDNDGALKTTILFTGELDEKESKKDEAMEFILDILGDGSKTTPNIVEIVFKEKRIGERNVREALKELLGSKLVDKRKNGRKDEYFLFGTEMRDSAVDDQEDLANLFIPS